MKIWKNQKYVMQVLFGAALTSLAATSVVAQAAFQADCNAYLTMKHKIHYNGGGPTKMVYNPAGKEHQYSYSLLIIPDIGYFAIGSRSGKAQAIPLDEATSKELLSGYLDNGAKTLKPNPIANWIMNRFECVAKDTYLQSTLNNAVTDVTQKFEASEMRVRDALLRTFSGQMASLIGRIDAIRREIPSLPQSDRDELNDRLTILESQLDTALKDICVAIKLDEAQC